MELGYPSLPLPSLCQEKRIGTKKNLARTAAAAEGPFLQPGEPSESLPCRSRKKRDTGDNCRSKALSHFISQLGAGCSHLQALVPSSSEKRDGFSLPNSVISVSYSLLQKEEENKALG